ncbi:cell division protein ZapA [Endozoicomonadaceae bacterium StTr2]
MSANSVKTTVVNILEKDYRISCSQEEEEALFEAARYLDAKMRDIRAGGKVIGLERIAVMAALNITHEMLHNSKQSSAMQMSTQRHLRNLTDKLDAALQDNLQPEEL